MKKKNYLDQYVIHIPHASLKVPKCFQKNIICYEKFVRENLFLCDYLVENFVPNHFPNVVFFPYSRMFCDVERYLYCEEMSKYGMGVLYTKDSNGRDFVRRKFKDNDYIIKHYYLKHHEKLDIMVGRVFKRNGKCIIIDLHSFSDEFVYKMFHKKNNPDICIGINQHYNKKLLYFTILHFKKFGYSVKINDPYRGSIISNRYPKVESMMIEINKRIYLSSISNYFIFYRCMMEFYEGLNQNKM